MANECNVRFWPPVSVIAMADGDKLILLALGAFMLGGEITRLDWALVTSTDRQFITQMLSPLREYKVIERFELIGIEANEHYDELLSKSEQFVDSTELRSLKAATPRWKAIAEERLSGLFLSTPRGILDPKVLLQSLPGFLTKEDRDVLDDVERNDLEEACLCLLSSSNTAAEQITLRAAEGMLRRWYKAKTGKTIKRPWGAVIDKLEDEYPSGQPRPDELAALGYLKLRRNAIDHPGKISTAGQAAATFTTVNSLVGQLREVMSELDLLASQSEKGSNAK